MCVRMCPCVPRGCEVISEWTDSIPPSNTINTRRKWKVWRLGAEYQERSRKVWIYSNLVPIRTPGKGGDMATALQRHIYIWFKGIMCVYVCESIWSTTKMGRWTGYRPIDAVAQLPWWNAILNIFPAEETFTFLCEFQIGFFEWAAPRVTIGEFSPLTILQWIGKRDADILVGALIIDFGAELSVFPL